VLTAAAGIQNASTGTAEHMLAGSGRPAAASRAAAASFRRRGAERDMTDVGTTVERPPDPTGRRALGDILVQVVGRVGNGLLSVVVMVVLARSLGTGDFGRWTTLITVVSLAVPLSEVGLSQVAITRAAEKPQEEGSWLGALLLIRTTVAIAAAAACLVAVLVLGDSGGMRVAGVLVTGTVVVAGISSLGAVFQLRVRNDLAILVVTLNSLIWTAAVVEVDRLGGGLVALGAVFLAAAVAAMALQTVLALRLVHLSFESWRRRARDLVRIGLPISISTLLIVAYVKADQILVFSLAGGKAAGLYGAAYRILDQMIIISASVTTTLYPLLVRAHATDPERFRFLLQRALEALLAIALGALAFAIPCSGDAMALVFGESFRAAGPTLTVLMGVLLLTSVSYLNGTLVLIFGLQRRLVVFAAAGLVVNLGLNVALIPVYGYIAAAWATVFTELVVVVLTSRATVAALGWRPSPAVALRAALAAALTSLVLAELRVSGIPTAALVGLTPVVYGGLLVVTGGLRVSETLALLRRGRG
jgi:O-antigen/teichoic acid export membrane protein